jgi:hypothetical protein
MSGTGKSSIYRLLKNTDKFNKDMIDINDIGPSEEPLIDDLGMYVESDDIKVLLKYLSYVGLCETFNYIQPYKNLSEGQKFRYRLLICMLSDYKIITCDEFGSNLDNITSRIICINLCRSLKSFCKNKSFWLFGVNTDFLTELKDDFIIYKKNFNDKLILMKNIKESDFRDKIIFEEGTTENYKELKKYHYINHNVSFVKKVYCLKFEEETVGVLVFCYPALQLKGRNIITNKKYSGKGKLLNKEVLCISRVVIHPTFRGIGLSSILLQKSIDEIFKFNKDLKLIELISTMTNFSPFCKRIMKKCEVEYSNPETKRLDKYGFTVDMKMKDINNKIEDLKDNKKFTDFVNKKIKDNGAFTYSSRNNKKINPCVYKYVKSTMKRKYLQYWYFEKIIEEEEEEKEKEIKWTILN